MARLGCLSAAGALTTARKVGEDAASRQHEGGLLQANFEERVLRRVTERHNQLRVNAQGWASERAVGPTRIQCESR